MEYQVKLFKMGDQKYRGYIVIKLNYNGLKIHWTLSDCGCYPSSKWIELLNFINFNAITDTSPIVGGGENSTWTADVTDLNFRLCFDISGGGGDSEIIYEFPIDKMIPVIEQIIEKIKEME